MNLTSTIYMGTDISLPPICMAKRRATGSAFKPFAGIARGRLQLVRGGHDLLIYGEVTGTSSHDVHCKRCGSMPEIVMLGKNFLIRCNTCNSEKINVYANNIDEAVRDWNRENDPNRRNLIERLRSLFRRKEP